MTGVQTCALPICFPVTIHGGITSSSISSLLHIHNSPLTSRAEDYVFTGSHRLGILDNLWLFLLLLNGGFTDVVEDRILRIVLFKADKTVVKIVELDMGSDADC